MARAAEPDPLDWVQEHWEAEGLPEPERFTAMAAVLRTHALMVSRLDRALKPFGVNRSAYLVLVTLALSQQRGRRLSYLSRYLMVHPTTVTLIVDQLERRRLVRRTPHPDDRRSSLVVLTARGRTLTEAATTAAAEAGFGLDGVGDRTLGQVTRTLRAVRRDVGDLA